MSDYKYCPLKGGECLYNKCGWWSDLEWACAVPNLSSISGSIDELKESVDALREEVKKCDS